jgi:hypothetical protein
MPELKDDVGMAEGSSTGTEAGVDFSYPSKEDRTADINYILNTTGMRSPELLLDLSDSDLRKAYIKVNADAEAGRYDKKDGRTSGRNIGGIIEDTARGPIRYSKGGAVKGKTFRGSF